MNIKRLRGLLAYCRPGFEGDLKAELIHILDEFNERRMEQIEFSNEISRESDKKPNKAPDRAAKKGANSMQRAKSQPAPDRPKAKVTNPQTLQFNLPIELDPGVVVAGSGDTFVASLHRLPVFARQLLRVHGEVELTLDVQNDATRVSGAQIKEALLSSLVELNLLNNVELDIRNVVFDMPDTNDGRELAALAQSLTANLQAELSDIAAAAAQTAALAQANVEEDEFDEPLSPTATRLHILLQPASEGKPMRALIATAFKFSPPWSMGIARVRVGANAPSRSAAKLAEAFYVLVGESGTHRMLKSGMRAVDLGAAPGGWSWWLAERGVHVTAIDNGPLKGAAYKHSHIAHLKVDGFAFKPAKPVDWLVCDMVESPARVAALVAQWFQNGYTRRAIFNLKLPMKQRVQTVTQCLHVIETVLDGMAARWEVTARQLYHDREEVTVFVAIRD